MGIILGIHNILRWVVMLAALFTLYRMTRGLLAKPDWDKTDRLAGLTFTIVLDLQLLLGLILYFILSPIVKVFFADFNTGLQDSMLRYWGIEHIGLMAAVVIFGHLGGAVARKNIPDQEKYRKSAIFFAIAIGLLLAGIPWFRPLLPNF